jgi:hypothetical protein
MEKVSLSQIENVSRNSLNSERIAMLENGYSSFDTVLNSSSDPIALYRGTSPYEIADGRHRIYLARQKGYEYVHVRFV